MIEGTTFEFTASNSPHNVYVINATTCMGELDATGIAFNASDEWYDEFGTFSNLKFYFLPWCLDTWTPLREQATYRVNIEVVILPPPGISDTGAPINPFQSIAETHTGTISHLTLLSSPSDFTPTQLKGTCWRHTKSARIWNAT